MTDRELLELAAKAAGISLEWDGPPDKWQPMYYQGKTYHSFDPLTDDGDALRQKLEGQRHDDNPRDMPSLHRSLQSNAP